MKRKNGSVTIQLRLVCDMGELDELPDAMDSNAPTLLISAASVPLKDFSKERAVRLGLANAYQGFLGTLLQHDRYAQDTPMSVDEFIARCPGTVARLTELLEKEA